MICKQGGNFPREERVEEGMGSGVEGEKADSKGKGRVMGQVGAVISPLQGGDWLGGHGAWRWQSCSRGQSPG